jgi:hypothetical protein
MAFKDANLHKDALEEQCGTPFIMFIAVISNTGMKNFKNAVSTQAVCADRLDKLQEQYIQLLSSKGQVLHSTLNGLWSVTRN